MRTLLSLVLTLSLLSTGVCFAAENKPQDFRGEIIFKDGTSVSYTWLWSDLAGDRIPWSKNLTDMKGNTLDLMMITLSSVAVIDFLDFTPSEDSTIDSAKISRDNILKAKITFNDGTVYDSVYLYKFTWKWKGNGESGQINSKVKSMTIRIEK